ncbi:uncharacterized protein BDW70DRAFT_139456 [Aspergillus foveolatus]|uniref:uncharacterized protein n=1 Tax=Aspergillus foveolatus TaxID=210207 RepID=UPI003CCDF68B
MPFEPQDLDSTIDVSSIPPNKIKWVEGKNQWVYWVGCKALTFYENKGEGIVHKKLTGQVKLPPGIELYFVGGNVKEE